MDGEQRRIIGREIKRSMRIDSCGSSTGGGAAVMGSDIDDNSVGSSINVGDSNSADEQAKRKGAGDDGTRPSVYSSTASSSSPAAAAAEIGSSAHFAKMKIRRRSPAAGRVSCRCRSSTPAKPGASLRCPPCKRTADFLRNDDDDVSCSKVRKNN